MNIGTFMVLFFGGKLLFAQNHLKLSLELNLSEFWKLTQVLIINSCKCDCHSYHHAACILLSLALVEQNK